MTTTPMLNSGPVPSEHARRAVPIAADLLPTEIVEYRRGRSARTIVVAGLAVLVLLLGAWYGFALYQTSSQRQALTGVDDDVSRLQAQQNRFADVLSVQAESKRISGGLTALMANDLQWSKVVDAIRGAAPGGVTPSGITGNLATNAAAVTTGGGAVDLPDHSGHKVIGKVTITGAAGSKNQVAGYADALAKVDGLTGLLVVNISAEQGPMKFTLQASLTDVVLGGRFSANTTGSGAK